jgi:hypothetical protein
VSIPAKGSGTGTGSAPRDIRMSCGLTTMAVAEATSLTVSSNASLNHLLNQYHIATA